MPLITEASISGNVDIGDVSAGTQSNDIKVTLTYDVDCGTGIYVGFDASVAGDLTVSYR